MHFWQYASVRELILISGSMMIAAILVDTTSLLGVFFLSWVRIPRSIPFIFPLLALAAVAGPRLAIRTISWYRHGIRKQIDSQPVMVMGAGDAGSMIVRELEHNPRLGMHVVGIFDDDPHKLQMRIHGATVLGTRHDIPRIAQEQGVRLLIIAIPTAPGREIREIVKICEGANVEAKIIPSIAELLDGTVSVSQLRSVQIEDLLRRKPIETDIAAVREMIRGKRVLVTGGGGSIGSELCRQVLHCEPAELIVMGHGENSVFEIQHQLLKQAARQHARPAEGTKNRPTRISPVIADIRFIDRIHTVFTTYRPEIVFHAAAHKHVPLMEDNPSEAITNNVLGTRNLLAAALQAQVQHFVMISTDKAVNPTSVMGTSKRVAELLVHQAAMESGCPYVAVRFGNVLGSRGSVVLTFRQQIAAGGPITVTHPEMRRFFMTIPEAVQLSLQAAVLGKGGEVFTLDMGEPIKIVDLARDMITLSGLEVGHDIEIAFSGLRPGEKLYEELFVPGEEYHRTAHEKIFIAANASNFVPHNLQHGIDALLLAAQRGDDDAIFWTLRKLVPQYKLPRLPEPAIEDERPWACEPLPEAVIEDEQPWACEPQMARAVGT